MELSNKQCPRPRGDGALLYAEARDTERLAGVQHPCHRELDGPIRNKTKANKALQFPSAGDAHLMVIDISPIDIIRQPTMCLQSAAAFTKRQPIFIELISEGQQPL